MRRLLPRMVAVLALLGVALCAPAFGQNSDPISLWSVPSVRVNGADPSAFTPDTTASLFKPATVSFTIPYDPRWADSKGWDIDTDENEYSAILTFHGTDGAVHNVQFGMQIPQLQRAVKRGRPTIEIPRDVMAGTPLVVTLQGSEARPGARILSSETEARESFDNDRLANVPLIVLCGFFLAIALTNVVLFLFSRDVAYLYYSLTMLAAAMVVLRQNPGLFYTLIIPRTSAPVLIVSYLSVFAYVVATVAFTRSFLRTRALSVRLDRLLLVSLVAYIVFDSVVFFFFTNASIGPVKVSVLGNIADAAILVVILGVGIEALRRHYEPARFFVVAFSGVVVGVAADSLFAITGVRFALAPYLGIAWEGLFLTVALADRVRKLNLAKDAANAELLSVQSRALAEARRHSSELEYVAMHDRLTGLPNRSSIEHVLAELGEFSSDSELDALAYVDIDHFKVVNDTEGHAEGDRLLVLLAQTLESAVDSRDTVARVGGDEFAIVLRARSEEALRRTCEALREAIANLKFAGAKQRFPISASVGCAVRRGSIHPTALLALADAACARAKDGGRNRVHFVSDEMSAHHARSEMAWMARIAEAFEKNRFRLYCQTIVALGADAPIERRVEVLIRLLDDDDQVIEPSHFLPAAERYDLIAQIDRWVISTALPLLAPMVANDTLQSISINLSGGALRDATLPQFILHSIEKSGIRSSALCFEITETVVTSGLPALQSLMNTLRPHGIKFALDDFGTGSSSLGLLKAISVDYLKIDGSFVQHCATQPIDMAIVEAIRRVSQILGLKTVAEYATDEAVVANLRGAGIDYAQGWAFGKAEPIELLTAATAKR